jgi:TonB-linked SusC/RagA family outer membrane protein
MRRFIYTLFLLGIASSIAAQIQRTDTLSVGYATGNAKTMSGSVEKVGEDRMNKGLITNSLDALSGQAAGVSISTGTNTSAMLSSVRVRGTTSLTGGNDPLVIIDGVQSDLTTLSNIYPGDIESFTILKDASETAQYGSRGASGVIEVATKKGQADNFYISYDGNVGFESIYKNIQMLDATRYRNVTKSMGMNIVDNGFNSDFSSSITRTGSVQRHHVAFGGGTEQSSFRASLGFLDHNTVIQRIGNRNFTAKIDVTQMGFNDCLKVDLGMFGSFQRNKYIHDIQKLFYSSASFNPTFKTGRNDDGSWSQYSDASQINHPQSLLDILDHDDNAHFNTHMKASFDLGHGLSIAAFGSYSYNVVNQSQFMPTYVWSHGQIYRGETKMEDMLGNILVSYNLNFDNHHLDLLGLAEVQKTILKEFHTTSSNLSTNDYGYHNLQAGAERLWDGTSSRYEDPRMTSFMGRVNYSYLERYSLTLNMRADASSKVGRNHRWGFFPSVSGAWVISDEPWMRTIRPTVNNLKLRLGYGLSGNLGAIDSYNSLELVKPNGVVPVNGSPTVTLGIIRNANPDLKWEVKHTFNMGLDLGFWNNRLVVTADYYHSKTTDMLYMYNVTVPPYPYDKLLANIGSMKNSGLEIGIGASLIQQRDIDFNANVNIAFQQNKLVSLSGKFGNDYLTAPSMSAIGTINGAGFHGGYNDIVYQAVGQPLGVFYLPHCTGLIPQADGTYRYEIADLNGDGVRDVATDRYFAGQATPKVLIGSNFSFRYKDFDISLQVNGAFGHKIFNGTALTYMNINSLPYYNVMPEAPEQQIGDQMVTDYWLERGDYLNFDYLTIGWNVPLGKAKYVRNLRLSLSVNNLTTITSYSGLTPMINSNVVGNTLGLDDKRTYPVYRSYSLGVSIQF